MNNEDGIRLDEDFIVLTIPKNTIELRMLLQVYVDHTLVPVTKDMDMFEIREAFKKAEDGYIDEDDEFVLSDEAKAYLDRIGDNKYGRR